MRGRYSPNDLKPYTGSGNGFPDLLNIDEMLEKGLSDKLTPPSKSKVSRPKRSKTPPTIQYNGYTLHTEVISPLDPRFKQINHDDDSDDGWCYSAPDRQLLYFRKTDASPGQIHAVVEHEIIHALIAEELKNSHVYTVFEEGIAYGREYIFFKKEIDSNITSEQFVAEINLDSYQQEFGFATKDIIDSVILYAKATERFGEKNALQMAIDTLKEDCENPIGTYRNKVEYRRPAPVRDKSKLNDF